MQLGTRLLAVISAAAALVTAAAGCSEIRPSIDATRVLHVENRVSQAVLVQIDVDSQSDGATYVTGLRPCTDTLSLTFGEQIPLVPNMDHWQTMLFVDPSGRFDEALADWQGDPAKMPGTFAGLNTVVWARGDVPIESLPKWLTVNADGASLGSQPTPIAAEGSCPSLERSILHP